MELRTSELSLVTITLDSKTVPQKTNQHNIELNKKPLEVEAESKQKGGRRSEWAVGPLHRGLGMWILAELPV